MVKLSLMMWGGVLANIEVSVLWRTQTFSSTEHLILY